MTDLSSGKTNPVLPTPAHMYTDILGYIYVHTYTNPVLPTPAHMYTDILGYIYARTYTGCVFLELRVDVYFMCVCLDVYAACTFCVCMYIYIHIYIS